MNNYIKDFRIVFLMLFITVCSVIGGPFAPPAGQIGSTAIDKSNSGFKAWATGIDLQRGFMDITDPAAGYVFYGAPTDALGPAEGNPVDVVSLGDGGVATLTFANPITNGPGYDFAVFENAINDTFLELAFVEVSSDGVHFFPFDCHSLTPTNRQVSSFASLDATNIHNLAGKYRRGFGTPFDLEELENTDELLDVNAVTHVRVIDVIGFVFPPDVYADGVVDFLDFNRLASAYLSLENDENWNVNCDIAEPYGIISLPDLIVLADAWLQMNLFSSIDSYQHQINDPWPTNFNIEGADFNGTGGFDLDGVGVIHEQTVE